LQCSGLGRCFERLIQNDELFCDGVKSGLPSNQHFFFLHTDSLRGGSRLSLLLLPPLGRKLNLTRWRWWINECSTVPDQWLRGKKGEEEEEETELGWKCRGRYEIGSRKVVLGLRVNEVYWYDTIHWETKTAGTDNGHLVERVIKR